MTGGGTWFEPRARVGAGGGPTVVVGAGTASRIGAGEGAVVRVEAEGRAVLAQVGIGPADDGAVALDRASRAVLRPFPYDPVVVTPLDPPTARSVTLAAAGAGADIDAILARGAAAGWPVRAGMALGGADAAALHVVAVSPDEAVLDAYTDITVDPAAGEGHGHGGHSHGGSRAAAERQEPGFDDVGGLAAQIAAVRELVELPLLRPEVYAELGIAPPRGVLFCGPPGTGKTLTARAVATEIEAAFYRVSGPEIVGSYSGQTEENLRRLFADAERSAPSVILVDEIDALAPSRRTASTMSDTRSVGQLLALMDGLRPAGGVVVIGTTNQVEALDPALRRPGRFDRELFFATPAAAEREQILRIHLRAMPLSPDAAAAVPDVAAGAHGFVGADLMELAREAGLRALRRRASLTAGPARLDAGEVVVDAEDLHAALAAVRPAALRQSLLTDSPVTMAGIGGYPAVKRRLVEVGRLAVDGATGRTVGVLLHGPPGTGKSLLAQALAAELGVNLMVVRGPEVYSQWLGESEEAVRRLFAVARRSAPVVVVIDQLDALAPARERSGGDPTRASQRVVGQLLAELDGGDPLPGVLVVGVTARPEEVDPAVCRPGRIGLRVPVDLPGDADRRAILDLLVARAGATLGAWDPDRVKGLVAATAGMSGADLAFACDLAGLAHQRRGGGGPLTVDDVATGLAMLAAPSEPSPGVAVTADTVPNSQVL